MSFTQEIQPQVSMQLLAPDHYHMLVQAIQNVLSTEVAEITMAQLIDGLPLMSTAWNMRGNLLLRSHPLSSHETMCEGAVEQAKAFRDAFDPAILSFDVSVIQAYQDATPGSHPFELRLVEILASSIHQIGVILFKYEPKLHVGNIDSVVSFKEEAKWVNIEGRKMFVEPLFQPYPTLFFHVDYMMYDHYPNGLADTVGYWAEDRILGGVALFDRGTSGMESNDIYFQSGLQNTTFRTWRLLDTQFDAMAKFLLADTPPAQSPFPILATDENLHRYDPWDAMSHHIYRDAWERDLPPKRAPNNGRDVVSTGDYPELEEVFKKIHARAEGLPYVGPEGNIVSAPPSAPPSPGIDLARGWPSPAGSPGVTAPGVAGDADDYEDLNSLCGSRYTRSPLTQEEDDHAVQVAENTAGNDVVDNRGTVDTAEEHQGEAGQEASAPVKAIPEEQGEPTHIVEAAPEHTNKVLGKRKADGANLDL